MSSWQARRAKTRLTASQVPHSKRLRPALATDAASVASLKTDSVAWHAAGAVRDVLQDK